MKSKWPVIIQFSARFGAALFNLATSLLVSRLLGAELKGDHALFIFSVAFIQLWSNWVGVSTLVYLAPRHSHFILFSLSAIWAVFATLSFLPIFLLTDWLPSQYTLPILVSSILFSWWNSLAHLALGKEKHLPFNVLQFLFPALTFVLSWILIEPNSLQGFVWGYCLAHMLNFTVAMFWLKPNIKVENESWATTWKVLWKHASYIQLANGVQFLNYRLLFLLIDHFFGRAFLGIYSNAQSIIESVWMITRSISTVQLVQISNSQEKSHQRKLTFEYLRLSAALSSLALLVLLLIPDAFYTFVFGKEFVGIQKLLVYLSPAVFSMSISNIYAHYHAGMGINKINFTGSVINLVALLFSFFILLPFFHELSAALAFSLSFVASLLFHYYQFRLDK